MNYNVIASGIMLVMALGFQFSDPTSGGCVTILCTASILNRLNAGKVN
jgi:hypothetical protein